MQISKEKIAELQAKFSLGYHIPYLFEGDHAVSFAGKSVLEVGGSLPKELVLDTLGAERWISIEDMTYWHDVGNDGGGTPPKAVPTLSVSDVESLDSLGSHYTLNGQVEDVPECLENCFDRVFSIACFEHVHTLGLALEKMYAVLKPGGKLFTMFSPIWSAYNGHHIPHIVDANGVNWSFQQENSPIPPWGHLLFTPATMDQHLQTVTDRITTTKLVYHIYHNPHINRLFTEDYVEYVSNSPFEVEAFHSTFPFNAPQNIQSELERRFPGKKHFSNNGVRLVLKK